jgi:hypothetical protein
MTASGNCIEVDVPSDRSAVSVNVVCVAVGDMPLALNGNCACQYPGVTLAMLATDVLPLSSSSRVTFVDVVALSVICVPLDTTFGETVT